MTIFEKIKHDAFCDELQKLGTLLDSQRDVHKGFIQGYSDTNQDMHKVRAITRSDEGIYRRSHAGQLGWNRGGIPVSHSMGENLSFV